AAGLCLFPAWLLIPVPLGQRAPVAQQAEAPAAAEPAERWEFVMPELPPEEGKRRDAPAAEAPITALPPRPAARESWRLADWVMLGYGVVAGTLLLRWLAGNLALQWLLRQRRTAPVHLAELFAEMAAGKGCRLVVSERAGAPFSIGLFKKTVVLPAALVEAA